MHFAKNSSKTTEKLISKVQMLHRMKKNDMKLILVTEKNEWVQIISIIKY